ncbi:hypothetical protein QE152_g38743 [Popillia japonica]|uniref:Uncharacterized protein n=1 Tax=Popillia japonica TaxID=7064 RepID=A0AAW1HWH5_POPJA
MPLLCRKSVELFQSIQASDVSYKSNAMRELVIVANGKFPGVVAGTMRNALRTVEEWCVIVANGKFPGVVAGIMRNALRTVEEWCLVSVNPHKTRLIAFTNIRKLNDLSSLKLFGQKLQLIKEVKYLGVALDAKLN